MAEKTLSICIPTFNRANALERTLEMLKGELQGIEGEVEVCISDNGSTDGTVDLLARWGKRLPLVYSRNKTNLGFDINLIRSADLAKGTFIWFMGDDDRIIPGTVRRLLADVKSCSGKKVGAIFVTHILRSKKVFKFGFDDFRLFRKEDINFELNLGFIGTVCVNRSIAHKIIRDTVREGDAMVHKAGFDYPLLHGFMHSYLFLECAKEGEYIGAEPLYGMNFVATEAKASYKKKIFLELIMARYYLEIRRYYPWIRDSNMSFIVFWKRLLSVGAIAAEQPQFESAYNKLFRAYMEILRSEGRRAEIVLAGLFEMWRKNRAGGFVLVRLHGLARERIGLSLNKEEDRNPVLEKDMQFVMSSIDSLLEVKK